MNAATFVDRPVLANVSALIVSLIGLVAVLFLPVTQYPPITPPTVQVTARFPGADARTVVETVALPIEQQVNGVENMLYMQSTAANDGSYTLVVTFAVGTDLDQAQVQVQNRLSAALAILPQAVQAQGVTSRKKSTAILQIVTLTSPDRSRDGLFLSNYAAISLKDALARIPGVADASVFGVGQYGMRVWLDADAMRARGLMPGDVLTAIQQQSQAVAAGQVGAPPAPTTQAFQVTLDLRGRFADAAEFEAIAVKTEPGGGITRIRDIGRVELGAQTYSQFLTLDGAPAAGIAIFQLPGANALTVADAVRAEMARLGAGFPEGVASAIPFDTTRFVEASIHEVYLTLAEAAGLVLLVILLFLHDWRATLVPATTVPVTVIGAFAALWLLGFSINLLTLFGLVLAIGIVVDDAIMVVEGATHHIEAGLDPRSAAVAAMGELMRPILAITLVLLCVFLPATLLPGIVGQFYRQFALVIAATAVLSAINAATLKPTQCARWLRPRVAPSIGFAAAYRRGFDGAYGRFEAAYLGLTARLVRHAAGASAAALALLALGLYGLTRLPTAFIPTEDQGYLMVSVQLPDGASLERTARAMDRLTAEARAVPGVEQVVAIGGVSLLDNNASLANAGVAYVILKDWSLRGADETLRAIYGRLQARLSGLAEARLTVVPPPPIQGLGLTGGFQMQVQLVDGSFDYRRLQQAADALVAAAAAEPGLVRVTTPFRAGAPHLRVDLDRRKAETLGVNPGDALQTIQTYVGSTYVGQITRFGHTFPIFVQADAPFRLTPETVETLTVRNASGVAVPVGVLAQLTPAVGPALVPLFDLAPSAAVIGVAAPGTSSGQALAAMTSLAQAALPPGTRFAWSGISYQEAQLGGQAYWVFGLALLLVYLVLAGQYESWTAPLAVILVVPLALLGTVTALMLAGADNNIYTQVGLVLLIALAAKNAILVVAFARDLRLAQGLPIAEAALAAARLRLRPILMTSLAFILGVLPLVFATGAGAAARRSIGIAVCSGMLASTFVAVLFVPPLFVMLQRVSERGHRPGAAVEAVPGAGATPATGSGSGL
ncbi:efflux RND transporter permease subunit [uncultured Methylobacterium sp.]|uniref:efflux RND transporter permease subunit n=1 Tax=uncultured Methylobacterium sp. TaxID=157278 RepID=UPI002591FE7F|nr:efflux RND transporter permease subunit [uncultured Methylobacterium sp.]